MIYFRSYRAVLIALAVVSLAASPAAFADQPVHKASGGGSAPIPDEPMESYGFQAQIDADGDVKGKAVFQFRPQEAKFFGDITCLHVNGNDAWLGGELTKIDVEGFPPLPIYFVWMVRDNGQGAASVSDQVGQLLLSLNPGRADTCTTEPVPPMPLTDLTNGNIKVD
jgi:hypothetical protein